MENHGLKRMLLLLLTLLLVLAAAVPALAADDDSWLDEGNYDKELFDFLDDDNNISELYNIESEALELDNAAEFAAWARVLSGDRDAFEGKHIRLTNDIDLSEHLWEPVSFYDSSSIEQNFAFFYGDGHSISGLRIEKEDEDDNQCGLFGEVGNAYIENLTIYKPKIDISVKNSCYTGALAGAAHGAAFHNCAVIDPDIYCESDGDNLYIGGLLGEALLSVITGCSVQGGAIQGQISDKNGYLYLGGLIGHIKTSAVINCFTHTDLKVKDINVDDLYLGGLIGYADGGDDTCVINCWSRSDLTASGTCNDAYLGGLCGLMLDDGCNNYTAGSIDAKGLEATKEIGQVFGRAYQKIWWEGGDQISSLFINHNYGQDSGWPAIGQIYDDSDNNNELTHDDNMARLVKREHMLRLLNDNVSDASNFIFYHKRDWLENGYWGKLLHKVPDKNFEPLYWVQRRAVNDGYPVHGTFEEYQQAVQQDMTFTFTLLSGAGRNYADAPAGMWFEPAASLVSSRGLMQGVGQDTGGNNVFAPNENFNRAMAATVLYRLHGSPAGYTFPDKIFPDVLLGDWYYDAAYWAAGRGVVLGHTDGLFHPLDPVTHEQLAAMLCRIVADKAATPAQGFDWAEQAGFYGAIPYAVDGKAAATRAEIACVLAAYIEMTE